MLVTRGCRLSIPTSGIKSSVRGVRWLSRIDQEGFFCVRFLEGSGAGCFCLGYQTDEQQNSKVIDSKGS